MPQLDYNINRNFVYSNGQYYKTPKEYFKAVAKVIFEQGSLGNNTVVCDMGCAAGEFLLYLSSIDPAPRYIGFDVDESLITKAQSELSTFTFDVGAIQDRNLVEKNSLDICTFLGTHGLFDDIRPIIDNMIFWTKPGGKLYFWGPFNPYPLDILMRRRDSSLCENGIAKIEASRSEGWEGGWNIVSIQTIETHVQKVLGTSSCKFIPFEMPFDITPDPEHPVRSWTMKDSDGKRWFTNGMALLPQMYVLEISC